MHKDRVDIIGLYNVELELIVNLTWKSLFLDVDIVLHDFFWSKNCFMGKSFYYFLVIFLIRLVVISYFLATSFVLVILCLSPSV